MNENLISVIIPVYNTAKYLRKCLNSVINQTYKNLEIIIINDGSTDDSLNICNEYKKKDTRIVIISQKNLGVSSARNRGINLANGEYVIFIDSDDFLELNMIENMFLNLKEYDIFICDYNKILNNKVMNSKEQTLESRENIYNSNEFFRQLFLNNNIGGYLWNKLIRKSIIADIRFDEKISIMEDIIFLAEISKNAKKIIYVENEYLYNYVIRTDSAINSNKINESMLDAFDKIIKLLENNKDIQKKCMLDYVYEAMKIKYKFKNSKNLSIHKKNNLNKIRKRYLKEGLKNDFYNTNKKIKMIFVIFLPNIYFRIKRMEGVK